jgi:putative exosortase-associated protein (TIGR04073 family)
MGKGVVKYLLVIFIALVMISFSSNAFAESTADKMFAKLGRGLVNTATGLVGEIVAKTKEDTKDGNFGGYLTGPIKGVGYGAGRTIIGAYEALTFLIPLPSDYAQILEPKYAWGE